VANYSQTQVSLGENSKILVLGQYTFSVTRGTVREDPGETVLNVNQAAGYEYTVREQRKLLVDVEMFWIPASNPLANPPNLIAGNTLIGLTILGPGIGGGWGGFGFNWAYFAVQIWPDVVNQPDYTYYLPAAYIGPQSVVIQGDGVQTFSGSFKNMGFYSTPSSPF
jgi:hypothetical protein